MFAVVAYWLFEIISWEICLRSFHTVGWALGRASGV